MDSNGSTGPFVLRPHQEDDTTDGPRSNGRPHPEHAILDQVTEREARNPGGHEAGHQCNSETPSCGRAGRRHRPQDLQEPPGTSPPTQELLGITDTERGREAARTYAVIIQAGAIAAVGILYRAQFGETLDQTEERRFAQPHAGIPRAGPGPCDEGDPGDDDTDGPTALCAVGRCLDRVTNHCESQPSGARGHRSGTSTPSDAPSAGETPYLSASDAATELDTLPSRLEIAIEHATADVPIVHPTDTAGAVRGELVGRRFDSAADPVVCVDGRLVGMDEVEHVLAAAADITIDQLMDHDPPTVGAETDQEIAARRMLDQRRQPRDRRRLRPVLRCVPLPPTAPSAAARRAPRTSLTRRA